MRGRRLTGRHGRAEIVRIGKTVRRPPCPNSEFVHALLLHFEAVGFGGAPRLLGVDGRGREILTFVEGEVVREPAARFSDARLLSVGQLIRAVHDATAGSELAGAAEVVCHGQPGPHNTVFSGDEAVAFIDWDTAAAGSRVSDLFRLLWLFGKVGERGGAVPAQARRVRLLCEGYGWDDPGEILDELEDRFRWAAAKRRIEGDHASARFYQAKLDWMVETGPALNEALEDARPADSRPGSSRPPAPVRAPTSP